MDNDLTSFLQEQIPFEEEKATFEYINYEGMWVWRSVLDVTRFNREDWENELERLVSRMSILVGLISHMKAKRDEKVASQQSWLMKAMSDHTFPKSATNKVRIAKVLEDQSREEAYKSYQEKIRRMDASIEALNGLFDTVKRAIDACRTLGVRMNQLREKQTAS